MVSASEMVLQQEPLRLKRVTLHEQVVDVVRDLIIQGRLKPGSRVVESELCMRLGVSRTPLREALKTLAGEGLVDLLPSRGAVVHAPTATEARDLLEVLSGIEVMAGRLACERATSSEIRRLRECQDAMACCYREGDRLGYYKINVEMHAALVELSHNQELARLHLDCSGRLRQARFFTTQLSATWLAAIDEHEEMMCALERRDAKRLSKLIDRHMVLNWDRIRGQFE